jgi:serine/threonine protein kinase
MDFRHDHIVDVFDHFTQGRSNYIVMEYVTGYR